MRKTTAGDSSPAALPPLAFSSFRNLHPQERERRGLTADDLRLRWPAGGAVNDSINRGYPPATVRLEGGQWVEVFLQPEGDR